MRLGLRQSKAGRCAGFLKNVYSPAPVAPELPIQIGAVDFKDPLSAVQTLKPRDSHGFSFPAKPPAENKTRVCAWLKSAPRHHLLPIRRLWFLQAGPSTRDEPTQADRSGAAQGLD